MTRQQTKPTTLYQALADRLGPNSHRNNWLNLFLGTLICLNVLAIVLESIPSFHLKYHIFFLRFEFLSVMIFSLEYILRAWFAVANLPAGTAFKTRLKVRLLYLISPAAIIDLVSILPFYLTFIFVIDLRFLRVLRLLRIFKLTRYSPAINALLSVLREEASSLAAAFFILIVLLISVSSGIYLIEHKVQPDDFGTIPDAMWWAMATLTTVGYGDATPITSLGKFFGGCVTLIGMGMVALPAGILASGFSDQLAQNKQRFKNELKEMLQDGELSEKEKHQLKRLQEDLNLDDEEAQLLIKMVDADHHLVCPHCHKSLIHQGSEHKSKISLSNSLKL